MEKTQMHILKATPETVRWGFFDNSLDPVLRVKPGDIVHVEAITHEAGDAPDLMIDEGVRAIYEAYPKEVRGPGGHILTGPIYVEGAEPGDVLEVKILDLVPREPYGSNMAGNWGMLYDEFDKKERVTVYELDMRTASAKALFTYEYPGFCDMCGTIIEPSSVKREPTLDGVSVPLGLHLGIVGLAPKKKGKTDSTPPEGYGGNIDNKHFGKGTSMYYPVEVEGALVVVGDGHAAEGDAEISGTAIEANLNAVIQFTLRKDIKISKNPILETDTAWMTHGFNEDLNLAIKEAALEAIDFLGAHMDLNRDEAHSLLSVAGNFHITQVVNAKKGVHCVIDKRMFAPCR